MGDPLRHLPRQGAKAPIRALAESLLNQNHVRPTEALRALCDFILRTMGLPQEVDEARYPDLREWFEHYSSAVALNEPFEDIFANVYMALSSRGHQQVMGQHFTPMEIAKLNARMLGVFRKPHDRPLCAVHDPACGSGTMLLAALQVHLENVGPKGLRDLSISGIDLDPLCARMAAVQVLANVNYHCFELGHLAIFHGNSLSLETHQMIVCAYRRGLQESELTGYLGFRHSASAGGRREAAVAAVSGKSRASSRR